VYNRRVGRWKLFGDVAQENSFSAAALRSMLQRERGEGGGGRAWLRLEGWYRLSYMVL
jgi:hypothetical protein